MALMARKGDKIKIRGGSFNIYGVINIFIAMLGIPIIWYFPTDQDTVTIVIIFIFTTILRVIASFNTVTLEFSDKRLYIRPRSLVPYKSIKSIYRFDKNISIVADFSKKGLTEVELPLKFASKEEIETTAKLLKERTGLPILTER